MGELKLQEQRDRRFAAKVSLIVSIVLMLFKFWAYNMTQSKAVFSDALESIVNIVAAGMALFVIFYSNKPVDQDHPYGHGKVEFFSATVEGTLVTFAGLLIVIESVNALFHKHVLHELSQGLIIVAGAGIANLVLGLYLLAVGKKNKSLALQASGHHVISDFLTSVAVVLGLAVVWLSGIDWLDPAIAIVVGVMLMFSGARVVRKSVRGLMDEEDPELLGELRDAFQEGRSSGIIQIHHVKVIRSGWFHHIDAHLVVPEFWDVNDVHENINVFERKVIDAYGYGGELNFHVDPCRQAYCKHCSYENCDIRKQEFVEPIPIGVDDLRSPHEPEGFRP